MQFSVDEGIAGYVARTGELLNIADPYNDPRFNPIIDEVVDFKTKSVLCVPVVQQGRVVAVIQALNKRAGRFFNEDDESLFQYLSESTGISLAQAALFDQVNRDRRQAQVDKIFIQILSKRLSTHKFVKSVGAAALVLLEMQRFSLYLVDHYHGEVWVTVEEDNIICLPMGVGIAGHVAETGDVVNIDDAYDWHGFSKEIDINTGFRTKSVVCVPVINHSQDKTIVAVAQGINRLNSKGAIVPFDDRDVRVFKKFCNDLSVVMRQVSMDASMTKMSVDRGSAMERKSSTAVPVFSLAKQYRTELESDINYSTESIMGWMPRLNNVQNSSESGHLSKSSSWDLEIFSMSNNEMMNAFEIKLEQFSLLENHSIDSETVRSFISDVCANYRNNAYHNFYHAFHVFHAVHCILKSNSIGFLNSFHVLSVLISAICHDIDHPGNNNAFEKESYSPLSIRYSDDSILERHHCAVTFGILKEDETNLFKNFSRDQFSQCRRIIIQSILATDMSRHADQLRLMGLLPDDAFTTMDKSSSSDLLNTFFSAILHTGDLAGQSLPLRQALMWGERVISEFAMQAKQEVSMGLPVAPFMLNSDNPVKAASVQKGYIDFILKPWWIEFMRFFPNNEDLSNGLKNIEQVQSFYDEASTETKGPKEI